MFETMRMDDVKPFPPHVSLVNAMSRILLDKGKDGQVDLSSFKT